MRVLTYVLCGICLAGGAVTSLAMTQSSPADDQPSATEPARSVRPHSSSDAFFADGFVARNQLPDHFDERPAVFNPGPLYRDESVPPGNAPTRRAVVMRPVRETVVRYVAEVASAEEQAAAKKLQDAIKSLKDSSEPEAQKKATETIQQQLSEQFDLDLKEREKELAEVEAKVKSLREKLDKRKAAREDIISLRLKTITNDAAGLGFPSGGGASETVENEFRMLTPANAGRSSVDVGVYSTSPRPAYPTTGTAPAPAGKLPIALPETSPLPPSDPLN